jgi:nucleoside-diphosphate-sugar epimerase
MANHCVLLTGATGFVGRNFLLRLLSEASVAKVIVPVRSAKKLEEQLREEGIEIPSHKLQVVVTRDDQWNLTPILSPSEGQTTLVHCAGINFGRSYEEYQKTNVLFFEKLLSEIGRVDRALVLSSQAAGGPTPEGVLARTENDADLPITFYGQSKLEMERVALQWAKAPLIILRPPMILGPRDTASLPLFQMARSLVRFRPSGRAKNLSFISVDDLVEAMWRVVSGA